MEHNHFLMLCCSLVFAYTKAIKSERILFTFLCIDTTSWFSFTSRLVLKLHIHRMNVFSMCFSAICKLII